VQKTRKKWLLLPTVALMAILAISTPLAQAATYSDYDRYDLRFWFIHNYWERYITIDTGADTWYIRWVTNVAPYSLLGTYQGLDSYVKMWDDKGWRHQYGPWFYPPLAANGDFTMSYPNSNTWAYAEFRWTYLLTPFIWNYVTLHCAVRVGN